MNERLIVLCIAALWACATTGVRDSSKDPPVGRVITAEQIQQSGATTAWEALKFTVRSHYFTDYQGQPTRIATDRGIGSLVLREEPLIFLNGARLADIQLLRLLPADEIETIRVLSGSDGTTHFGTSATAGVILLTTILGGGHFSDDAEQPPDTAAPPDPSLQ